MKMSLSFSTLLFALMVLAGSCKKETRNESADENLVLNSGKALSDNATEHTQVTQLLQAVREATARFHSTNQAIKAGYVPDDHCVSVPGLGGMGYHWVNPTLVDAVFDPLKPEVVLYATGPGGNLRLVAVEYIVVNTGQAAPTFAGQPFNVGGTPLPIPHWSLHAWIYETNPSGVFTSFNPNVSCP